MEINFLTSGQMEITIKYRDKNTPTAAVMKDKIHSALLLFICPLYKN